MGIMDTNVSAREAAAAWKDLQALVEAEAKNARQPALGQPRLQWSQAGALLFIGPWQVEARFDARAGFAIHFDRLGSQLGAQNLARYLGQRGCIRDDFSKLGVFHLSVDGCESLCFTSRIDFPHASRIIRPRTRSVQN